MTAATITITEADFMRRVTDLCDWLGLLWYHVPDSRRTNPGFPDLFIVGPGGAVAAELKTARGQLRREQRDWLLDLARAGVTAECWRPADWPHIETTLRKLARR